MENKKVKEAMQTLTQAMIDDPNYAHGWHCNIAMACYDAFPGYSDTINQFCDDGASRFMKLCFGVDTEK